MSEEKTERLLDEADFRGHLDHHFKTDPNKIIYNEFKKLYGNSYAEKFLKYRETFEKINREKILWPYPMTVNLALKNACNLRCVHCYRQYNEDESLKSELTWNEITGVIDQCADLGVPAMLFGTECEHFSHKDALKSIEYASEKGIMDIFVATNGLLLNEKIIDRLFDLKITRLTISVDAFTEETYRNVRGGDFERLLANINYFIKKRAELKLKLPVLRLSFVRFNLNRHEEKAFYDHWTGKADIVDVQTFMDIKNINIMKYNKIASINCSYPWNMLYISWDGSCKPCCSEFCKHLVMGNIAEQSIADLWTSDNMKKLRKDILDPENFPIPCINCMRSLGSAEEYEAFS